MEKNTQMSKKNCSLRSQNGYFLPKNPQTFQKNLARSARKPVFQYIQKPGGQKFLAPRDLAEGRQNFKVFTPAS